MYVHRELEKKIKPFLKRKEVLSIIGPRQSGKTTFIKHLAKKLSQAGKKVKFITFEKRADLQLFQNSIEDFKMLAEGYHFVFIDEFQYVKDGGQKLKYLYDTTKTKFIISGSSSLELTFQTGRYMVGRMLDFQLMPFSFREFLSIKNNELYILLQKKIKHLSMLNFAIKNGFGMEINKRLTEALEKYIIYGGYPAVVLAKSELEKQKILEGIVEKYLLQDIKGLLNLATGDELMKMAKFLAAQIGGMIKFSELSNISNLNYNEVVKHLNILEKTFVISLIKPFFTNKRTELTKNPKNYFFDSGVRNFLISDFRSAENRNDLGSVMENCAHSLLYLNTTANLKYWRTKSKAEVDFVIEHGQKVYPIEIKYTSKKIVGKSFYSFIDKFRPKVGIILTKDYLNEENIRGTKVKFIPLSYL